MNDEVRKAGAGRSVAGAGSAASWLDDLYRHQWGQFRNFFCPVMKRLRTEVVGSCKRRIYDEPAIPFQRLKSGRKVSRSKIARLQKIFDALDPFELKQTIENKLRALLRHQVRGRPSPAA
jgi:hypothetical protein